MPVFLILVGSLILDRVLPGREFGYRVGPWPSIGKGSGTTQAPITQSPGTGFSGRTASGRPAQTRDGALPRAEYAKNCRKHGPYTLWQTDRLRRSIAPRLPQNGDKLCLCWRQRNSRFRRELPHALQDRATGSGARPAASRLAWALRGLRPRPSGLPGRPGGTCGTPRASRPVRRS